ncbi:hypothetical protein J15TS10_12670 [Paenibacillus woosongensis]|uniref:Uncharacterized protein n=1 Tax=Paenibacillus woosongensis TaxID=307580 RepID=A0ABQ4MN85_9BACL|nr:hypothetical protein J15TS10_12670 [Paenibacillus woosongensis]
MFSHIKGKQSLSLLWGQSLHIVAPVSLLRPAYHYIISSVWRLDGNKASRAGHGSRSR